jgi:hypothetical protein
MASFERSLVDCFTELSEAPPSDEQRQRIATFAHSIADRAIELLPGVAETLPSWRRAIVSSWSPKGMRASSKTS